MTTVLSSSFLVFYCLVICQGAIIAIVDRDYITINIHCRQVRFMMSDIILTIILFLSQQYFRLHTVGWLVALYFNSIVINQIGTV